MSLQNDDFILRTENIKKLMLKLAIPAITAQLISLIYNVVDRMFIGKMPNGELAMAGVGIIFPLVMLVTAVASLIGIGGSPLASIKMGEGKNEEAQIIIGNGVSLILIFSILLTVLFALFKEPLLYAFGASSETFTYANDYISVYLIGIIFFLISLGLNPFINAQGFAKTGMISVLIGAILNIILDPILIFGFNMGVKGASLATVISQVVSAIWVLKFLTSKKTILKIEAKYLKLDFSIVKKILMLGISPFAMQATESIVLILFNAKLAVYGGDLAIGAMTIMSSVMQMVILPIAGLTIGCQPIISYNFGAKKYDRVKETFRNVLIVSFIYAVIMWILIMIIPQMFVNIFNNDVQLVEITTWAMRIYFLFIFAVSIQMSCQQTLLALGQARISLILSLLRKVFILIPCIIILPMIMTSQQLKATLLAQPIADIVAMVITVIFFRKLYFTLLNEDKR
ncbi:MAG: MATE family efflux transporter [Paraclostridium sp.]